VITVEMRYPPYDQLLGWRRASLFVVRDGQGNVLATAELPEVASALDAAKAIDYANTKYGRNDGPSR
jgi:hypothetical protein